MHVYQTFRANNMYPLEIGAVRVQLTNQKEQEHAEIANMKIEEIQTELEVKSSP